MGPFESAVQQRKDKLMELIKFHNAKADYCKVQLGILDTIDTTPFDTGTSKHTVSSNADKPAKRRGRPKKVVS